MDKASVQQDLKDLIIEIKPIDERPSRHLQELSTALNDLNQAKTWAAVDLDRLINPDSVAEQYKQRHLPDEAGTGRLIAGLELTRNIFIFLPIVITWLGISQATSAYQQFVDLCSHGCSAELQRLVQLPFLYLWEQGFGGTLPGIFRLSTIGLIDAGILAIIFLATFYVSVASVRSNRQNEEAEHEVHEEAHKLRSRLISVLADTTILLHSDSYPIVGGPVDALDNVAKGIVQMSRDILQEFKQTSTSILEEFTSLKDSLTSVTDEMENQLRTTQDARQQLLKQIGDIGAVIVTFQAAMDQFQAASEAASDQLEKLVEPIEGLTSAQQSLLRKVNESADYLRHSANHLATIQQDQKDWGDRIADTLEQQDDVVGKLDTITNGLTTLERQLEDFLLKLEKEREAQEAQALQIAAASRNFAETLNYTNNASDGIRSIAVDMGDIVNMMARLSGSSGANLVDNFQQASEIISESANDLRLTAAVVFDAAQELKIAATSLRRP